MSNKSTEMHRQGDVLLIYAGEEIDTKGMKKIDPDSRGRHVLAEGEATGHAHAVVAHKGSSLFEAENGELFLRTVEPTKVVHDEHGIVDLGKPGVWKAKRQREFVRGDIRLVAD